MNQIRFLEEMAALGKRAIEKINSSYDGKFDKVIKQPLCGNKRTRRRLKEMKSSMWFQLERTICTID